MPALGGEWRKASASNGSGSCVEVRRTAGGVEVRDTKAHGTGPVLSFTEREWEAFLDGTARGEFDLA